MQIFLIRVGADQSDGGGSWNGPVDSSTGRFVYVPIPAGGSVRPGFGKPYGTLAPYLDAFGTALPTHLAQKGMHLDPDFEHVTYGDRGNKGAQLANTLKRGDRLLFYSGLKDVRSRELVYALIGTIIVDRVDRATDWSPARYDENAHTRRVLAIDALDIVVVGQPSESGRLARCIPVGEYRAVPTHSCRPFSRHGVPRLSPTDTFNAAPSSPPEGSGEIPGVVEPTGPDAPLFQQYL